MTNPDYNNNPWFGISMGLLGVIVGYGLALGMGSFEPSAAPAQVAEAPTPTPAPAAAPAQPSAENVDPVDAKKDHIKGDKNATISVIEYSDIECPFCKRHHPTMEALIEEVDDVNWVYRHYPLAFHPNAQKASEAQECAADQGKFWEYTDLLFEKGVKNADYVQYAADLGLNKDTFKTCLDSEKHAQKVKDQMAKGSAAGVRGTPGNIVINNKTGKARLVSGAQGIDAFKTAIDALK